MPRYDVFLSYSRKQSAAVEAIARKLHDRRLAPWFDRWRLVPGVPWQQAIERALKQSETCAVFIGPDGLGPVQREESWLAISQRFGDPAFRVIPVLLPGVDRPSDDQLPGFLRAATWVQFKSVEDEESLRLLECGIRGVEPGPATAIPLADVRCPYVGMRAFAEDDWPFFFGRTAWTSRLVERLRERIGGGVDGARRARRLMGVLGPSGSGKSSLVLAGLLPALRHGRIPGSETWPIVTIRPGSHPLESLAKSMADLLGVPGSDVGEVVKMTTALREHPESLHLLASRLLKDVLDRKLVVVVDQFEEVFTVCAKPELRDAFFACLLEAAGRADGPVAIVLTLRADFYGHCAPYGELARELSEGHDLIGPMTDGELREAIEAPAKHVGCEVEASLVDALVKDASQDRTGSLPLLADVLLTLWEKRKDRTIRYDSLDAARGLVGALADRAESLFRMLPKPEQDACPSLFDRLVVAGDGTRETKRRVERRSLSGLRGDILTPGGLVDRLVGARLLVADAGEGGSDSGTLEVAHEALIRSWPRLQEWVRHDPESRRQRERITAATQEWLRNDRGVAYLFARAPLTVAADWARAHAHELGDDERSFLAASEARATRARRYRIAALVTTAVLAIAAGLFGIMAMRAKGRIQATADVLADLSDVRELALAVETLGPRDAESVARWGRLNSVIRGVRDRLPERRSALESLRVIATSDPRLAYVRSFTDPADEIMFQALADLTREGDALFAKNRANSDDPDEFEKISRRFVNCMPPDASARWVALRERISARDSPYHGLSLPEQFGLCPIGPDSGPEHLEEFASVYSGDLPRRENGKLVEDDRQAIVFVLVPGGRFRMGSPDSSKKESRVENEHPQHDVALSPFFLAKYECTVAQWIRLASRTPSTNARWRDPTRVSWDDCGGGRGALALFGLRLPSESEWEYACRARSTNEWAFGDDEAALKDYAWSRGSAGGQGLMRVHPVGQLLANRWGFHDMYGNASEWCEDGWHDNYVGAPADGAPWQDEGGDRVVRGGSCWSVSRATRSASRTKLVVTSHAGAFGVRPARSIAP